MFNAQVPHNFIMHYFDDDFGDYFTLSSEQNITDKMTIKIVASVADSSGLSSTSDSAPSHITDSVDSDIEAGSSSSAVCGKMRRKDIATYTLPKFDKDIEMVLYAANALYKKDGSLTQLSHGIKSRVLTRLASDIYENYNAYPTTDELQTVASTLISNYEGIKDHPGKGYEGWLNSMIFKMGNYRSAVRNTGSLEMSIHSCKRSKYRPDLPGARRGMKKMKTGLTNWQPEYPEGEDVESMDKHKLDLQMEMAKASPDQRFVSDKMAMTFAQRRRDINKNLPVAEIKKQWPALFSLKALEAEFNRLTNVNARRVFFSSLDANADHILVLLRERGGASGKQIQDCLATIDSASDASNLVTIKRDAVIKAVMMYLGTDVDKLCRRVDEDDEDAVVSLPVFIQSGGSNQTIIEGVAVCNTAALSEAVLCLFISHYVFNLDYGNFKMFLLFVQIFLAGIGDDSSKLPARVRSFVAKIHAVAKRNA